MLQERPHLLHLRVRPARLGKVCNEQRGEGCHRWRSSSFCRNWCDRHRGRPQLQECRASHDSCEHHYRSVSQPSLPSIAVLFLVQTPQDPVSVRIEHPNHSPHSREKRPSARLLREHQARKTARRDRCLMSDLRVRTSCALSDTAHE